MPRHIDQDVHSAFVEFRADDGDKCLSVQCIHCQQVRAKNTTRQKQHLLQCQTFLEGNAEAAERIRASLASDEPQDAYADASALDPGSADHSALGFAPNPRINGTPTAGGVGVGGVGVGVGGRPSLGPGDGSPHPSKKLKTKHSRKSGLNELPLREVHAAFVEFQANEDDKCMSAKCIYCNQVRAKNTSRQREHLLTCPGYQSVLKDRIPANNLRHHFDDDDVASSLSIPTPTLDLDFRMSIRVKPKINVGWAAFGRQSWISCIGGQWAGTWGKGVVLPGGQDSQTTVRDMATQISAQYLIQTNDEHPAAIICKVKGWWTGDRDVMERMQDPVAADNIAASRYKFRVTIELETGDDRYQDLNTGLWVGSGCRRGAEIVYDAYRLN